MDCVIRAFTARFGGRVCRAEPDGRLIYHFRGRDYPLERPGTDYEQVMEDSLRQGRNLVVEAFPPEELYPDPECLY